MPSARLGPLPLLLIACAARAGAAGIDGERLLSDAQAVLRINDGAWLDAQATQFAATSGINPAPLRAVIAAALYGTRSLEGIDLRRPALIAWRDGAAPLIAIVPLTDRRAFMDHFGALPGVGEPMIRVGERDGTTVYSQNTDKGLYEYRLLVQDDTAYVARSPDECRALAARPLRVAADQPPLVFQAAGRFLAGVPSPKELGFGDPLAEAQGRLGLGAYAEALRSLGELVEQVQSLSWSIAPSEAEGGWHVALRVVAKGDTALARWMANQRNQASRLLPAVAGPRSVLTVHGGVVWQGELERLGIELGRRLGHQVGPERWTAAVEEAWQQQWALLDQQGPFAGALDALPAGGGSPFQFRFVCEQPRAAELLPLEQMVAAALSPSGAPPTSEEVAVGERVGHALAIGDSGITALRVATEAHLVQVVAAQAAAAGAAGEVLGRLQTAVKPAGTPGMLVARLDLTRLVQAFAPAEGNGDSGTGAAVALAPVSIELACKASNQANVTVELDLPLAQIAGLLRDSMVLQRSGARLEGEEREPPERESPER